MSPFVLSILASLIISSASLVGIITVAMNAEKLSKILLFLVSLSSGALMGGAFLHLLPEAATLLSTDIIFPIVLVSFIFFFFVERLLHWRHCHKGHCDVHTFGYMNLIGDAIHNFIDGLIISGTFILNSSLGIITAVTLALHEIPQEIGDFGVLLYAGFSKKRALFLNFFVALTVVAGTLVSWIISEQAPIIISYLIPFAAGGFIYISASDLIPEIRKEMSLKKSLVSYAIFLLGIGIILLPRLFGVSE